MSVRDYQLINIIGTNRVILAEVPFSGAQSNISTRVKLPEGTNTLVVIARSHQGIASEDSSPLTVIVPKRPGNLRITIQVGP